MKTVLITRRGDLCGRVVECYAADLCWQYVKVAANGSWYVFGPGDFVELS